VIDRLGLHALKADILGVFVRQGSSAQAELAEQDDGLRVAAGGR